jgi:hypothetical protein
MNKIILTVSLISLISCSKSDTPTPVEDNTTVSTTPPTTSYYNSTYVQGAMVGTWSIYKHTHHTYTGTHEVYTPQPNDVIRFTTNTIQYNGGTYEPYVYSSYDIESINHHYYIEDMSSDSNWIYMYTYTPSYEIGYDTMFYSLARVQ